MWTRNRLSFIAQRGGIILTLGLGASAQAADVFLRCRVMDPPGQEFKVSVGGFIHVANWYLPTETVEVAGGEWSRWIDLTQWPLHGRLDRAGGVAEWPALKLSLARSDEGRPIRGCAFEVQLADRPDEGSAVISFTEKSGSESIAFLLPHPLREKKDEFETGSQMTARHLAWAKEASGGDAPRLRQFDLITAIWGHYDPVLARQAVETLQLLGFNVLSGVPISVLREAGLRTYTATWHLVADPEESVISWQQGEGARIAQALETEEGRWTYEHTAHYVIADEIQTMDFRNVDKAKLNQWFRDYLERQGETSDSLGQPLDRIEYPAEAMYEKALPRAAPLPTRKVMYYAAKFGQWWSVKQLRQTTDLVKGSFARLPSGMKTETLPSDHGFFNAWGPPYMGMGYRSLDFFEIGAQEAVDILSAEDWLGLNHMYGPAYTWTGAPAFGYLSAIYRSGIGDRKVALRGLITPSDDGYLRLKAYTALGQGAKSFFFWTFGPTYIGTENYWSDLRSEYDGIAKLSRALEKAEPILYPAQPVRDRVAILYSVSHDLWHTDDPASFVENRLTWTALRHLSVQPDFLREEDVEAGRLQDYQVLYVTGQCLTRRASAAIDAWVKAGGVVYLSAGAATRDEFFEPYTPSFAASVWPPDEEVGLVVRRAAHRFIKETGHRYNERVDLPTIPPLTTVQVTLNKKSFNLPVIGCRLNLREDLDPASRFAVFEDGRPAGARVKYGQGTVIAVGFLPGLAYSPFTPAQTTLDEVWPEGPRALLELPLAGLKRVVTPSQPVVEASLLTGPEGSALILVNYTYQPIPALKIQLSSQLPGRQAVSTEGVKVEIRQTPTGVELTLPLEWTDIVLLPKP